MESDKDQTLMSDEDPKPEVTVFICGTEACPGGGVHDSLGQTVLKDMQGNVHGASVSCSKCGSTAFDRDLLRLP